MANSVVNSVRIHFFFGVFNICYKNFHIFFRNAHFDVSNAHPYNLFRNSIIGLGKGWGRVAVGLE